MSVDPAVTTLEKLGGRYDFPLLADPGLEAIDAYGVRHDNGFGDRDIARPATFLIDESGRIVWRDLTDNWRIRVRPERILERLDALEGMAGAG